MHNQDRKYRDLIVKPNPFLNSKSINAIGLNQGWKACSPCDFSIRHVSQICGSILFREIFLSDLCGALQ